jgi:heme exporter protein D
MSWSSWSDFFAMGGYALYVWGSYAAVAALIATEVTLLVVRRRNIVKQLGLIAREREASNPGTV